MFINDEAKTISTLLRIDSRKIKSRLYSAFENSIVGCNREVQFLQNITAEINSNFNNLNISGLSFSCRTNTIHQKPIVSLPSGKRCELGDLLVVVKYQLSSGDLEVKSIIYQVKLTQVNSLTCNIDQTQLDLLTSWPSFSFGRASNGGPVTYNINPHTLEFGSFMLEQRNPSPGSYLRRQYRSYGICPFAMLVNRIGPNTVDITQFPYTKGDVHNFFSHIIFEIGEHHINPPAKNLVDALYRHVGLSPDPPDEFNEYQGYTDDDGFAVIEIKITIKEK